MSSSNNHTYTGSVIHYYNGLFSTHLYVITHYNDSQSRHLLRFLNDMRIITYLTDPSIFHLLSHCESERPNGQPEICFIDSIYDRVCIPNIGDIERCYYDELGIPDHLVNFYQQVVVVDDYDYRGGASDDDPLFKKIFRDCISSIKTIE